MNSFRSKEDHVIRISKSVFFTNFPDSFGSRDLWSLCEEYGIPLHLWSSSTFSRIGMKWGTVMDIEESPGSSFARKRLCIKTSMAVNILETFKVIYKGKVFMVRAKELFTWSPCFLEYKDPGYLSEDESSLDGNNNLGNSQQGNVNQVEESDVEEEDPSLSHPPRFTPVASHQDPIHSNSAHIEVNQDEPPIAKGSSSKSYLKVSCFSQAYHGNDSSADSSTHVSSRSTPKGGSILEVGRSMGYDMEGCSKDIEQIINCSIGNSGGILCVWEETIFKKVDVSISDNFMALYGIWLLTNSKILIVVIYAPQSFGLKRILWDYISGLITRWNEETIVLGGFNEVRNEDERFGSIFHQSYAREFNHFVYSSGLLEVKMEGYSFTWSHSSTSKMSKLDRFLVSEGIFVTFPTISALCLDLHLSDHRPILLDEIHIGYGPTPFRNLDKGMVSDELLAKRMDLSRKLHDLKQMELKDAAQKAKVNWAIEGDENSKFFHGVINKRRSQLAISGVFVNGDWYTDPSMVKEAFRDHFTARF
nr:RNA-directed DNA polymerase, eukaryota [Tanacetum cinerariifolium]